MQRSGDAAIGTITRSLLIPAARYCAKGPWPRDRGQGTVAKGPWSAAAGRSRDARADLGLIDDAGHHVPQHGAEVHHVPHPAPGDQGRDAERALLTVLLVDDPGAGNVDRKSTRLNSSHRCISYAAFCL